MKKNKTEMELVEEFLKKEGFTELTAKEIKSSEFRESILNIQNLKKGETAKKNSSR